MLLWNSLYHLWNGKSGSLFMQSICEPKNSVFIYLCDKKKEKEEIINIFIVCQELSDQSVGKKIQRSDQSVPKS